MISTLISIGRSPTKEQKKLITSLAANCIAKIPGIAAVFFILPAISNALGANAYGGLLAAMALGAMLGLPLNGIILTGRRLFAGAVGTDDRAEQANILKTTFVYCLFVGGCSVLIGVLASSITWGLGALAVACALPILGGVLNWFDNARGAYNEHYVSASFLFAFQVIIYTGIFLWGIPKGGILISAFVIVGPYILASTVTAAFLLMRRRFLLVGKIRRYRGFAAPAFGIMIAEGAILLLLNFSVYMLGAVNESGYAAWYGTYLRLFQSFLSPLILILFPITSYMASRWVNWAPRRKIWMHKAFVGFGVSYGAIVGVAMAIGGPLYIEMMFSLDQTGDWFAVLSLCVFLGAVVAQKTYTILLYSISEARFISYGTAGAASIAFGIAAISLVWCPWNRAIDALFLSAGILLPVVLCFGGIRQISATKRDFEEDDMLSI